MPAETAPDNPLRAAVVVGRMPEYKARNTTPDDDVTFEVEDYYIEYHPDGTVVRYEKKHKAPFTPEVLHDLRVVTTARAWDTWSLTRAKARIRALLTEGVYGG